MVLLVAGSGSVILAGASLLDELGTATSMPQALRLASLARITVWRTQDVDAGTVREEVVRGARRTALGDVLQIWSTTIANLLRTPNLSRMPRVLRTTSDASDEQQEGAGECSDRHQVGTVVPNADERWATGRTRRTPL